MSDLSSFIRDFFKWDRSLGKLFADYPDLNDPLIDALKRILRSYESPEQARQTLDLLDKLSFAHADPILTIIVHHSWCSLALSYGYHLEASAIHRRQKNLVPNNAPADLAAMVAALDIDFARFTGDLHKAERLQRELCERKGLTPRFYARTIAGYTGFLSLQGRMREALPLLKGLEPQPGTCYTVYRCTNDLETARIKEAAQELAVWEKHKDQLQPFGIHLDYCRLLLDLLRQTWPHGPVQFPTANSKTGVPSWAWATRALQERRADLAVAWANLFFRQESTAFNDHSFATFVLLRAHLAAGNFDAVEQLLHLRTMNKCIHYLDDFFAARVAWLKGEADLAAGYLARVMKAVEFYQAEGRLDFEFSLAAEMSPSDVNRLCRLAASKHVKALPRARPQSSPRLPAINEETNGLLGSSTALKTVRELVQRFAPLPAPILITGETGTGKELVARALHDRGTQRKQPFIAVNCGAISESLLESELFGHVRGAFTGAEREHKGMFEEAGNGALFLDEIGEIPPRLQVALLRVLENSEIRPVGGNQPRKIACRLIFATNVDLDAAVHAGRFRQDLLYRLRRLCIHLPPLRERTADIAILATHFLQLGRQEGSSVRLTPELEAALQRRPWPGNVRELRNEMERMVWLHPGRAEYDLTDLAESAGGAPVKPPAAEKEPAASAASMTATTAGTAPPAWQSKTSFRRLEHLRELFRQHRNLARLEVAKLLQVSKQTATTDLHTLCDEGFIEKVRPTAAPRSHYFTLKATP